MKINLHNFRAAQENELPTFTNEAYNREAIYDVHDLEEEEYRHITVKNKLKFFFLLI